MSRSMIADYHPRRLSSREIALTREPSDVGKFHWMTSSSIALFTWCIWLSVALLVYRYAYSPRFVPEQNTSMSPKPDPRHTLENGHFGCADDSTVFMWACLCPAMRWADTVDNAGLLRFWYAFALFAALSLLNYMNFFIVLIVGICALLARACKFHTFIAGFALEGREDSYRRELSLLAMWLVTVALVVTVFLSVHSLLRQFDGVVKTYFGAYGCFVFGCFTTILMVYYRQQLRDKFALPSHTAEIYAEDFCYLFWCPCCGIAQEARAVNEAHQIGHESVQTVSAGKPDESYGTA
eukprot:TRINITY_DN24409_c1_g4_i1.p1 TRINITY_DN24409_c1_g4~~TRINITY_DN24409_c1_g4_i1.p1  ORF type:complete len:295 (+),score=18.38 TRINITY_DN24409_c1_g4_i1:667-1551(+)